MMAGMVAREQISGSGFAVGRSGEARGGCVTHALTDGFRVTLAEANLFVFFPK